MLERNKPDIVWILESALTEIEKPRTFHDNYEVAISNTAATREIKLARGRGVMAFTKG